MPFPPTTRLLLRRFTSQTPVSPVRSFQTRALPVLRPSLHQSSPLRAAFHPPSPSILPLLPHRAFSASSRARNNAAVSRPASQEAHSAKEEAPAYEMTVTCKKCQTRSSHRISKQGYHNGTVLITCPGCKNRHLVADHLKIFSDKRVTIEDILKEKGQLVKRGTIGTDGDVELWDDGSQTLRHSGAESDDSPTTKI